MEIKFSNKKFILIVDAVICIFCLVGLYQLSIKPNLPSNITISNNDLNKHEVINLDTLLSLNGIKTGGEEEIEMLLDRKSIGDTVSAEINYPGKTVKLKLVAFYKTPELLVTALVAAIYIFFGIFVLLKIFNLLYAHIFHWCCICAATIMFMSWGAYGEIPAWLGFITRTGYHIAYAIVPATIMHFTLLFPKDRLVYRKQLLIFLYSVSALLAFALSFRFALVLLDFSSLTASNYISLLTLARWYIGAVIIASVGIFIYSHKTADERPEKKKLLWLLLGLIIGPLSYAVLWVIPYSYFGSALVPEIIVILLMSAIPITFSISIIKYNLMEIDLLIKRGVVYSIVISAILILYTGALTLFASELISPEYPAVSIIGVVVIVILIQPIKRRVQKFVDKKFFRVDYNFRIALKEFTSEIKNTNSIKVLAKSLVERTNELIPVTKIGFFILNLDKMKIRLLAHYQFDLLVNRSIPFETEKLKTDLSLPVAVPDKVEHGVKVEIADLNVFKRWGMDIVFPIKSSTGKIFGFLVLGEKKSGNKFSIEDVDLLNTVSANAAAAIERIKLQEEIILEQIENERLEELNELKSFFVRSVSHDLKEPLTSIKMFTELLKGKISAADSKSKSYLEIIDGESDRLTRMVNNVLDYSKIEKGKREFNFEKVDLVLLLKYVLKSMQYIFKIKGFDLKTSFAESPQYVLADRDGLMEVLVNLLSNSIKYSKDKKEISIILESSECGKSITVEDYGIGIAKENQNKLFEPFYRVNDGNKDIAGGAGLGLAIVKFIMDAHNAEIEIDSGPGRGSRFTLKFARKNMND